MKRNGAEISIPAVQANLRGREARRCEKARLTARLGFRARAGPQGKPEKSGGGCVPRQPRMWFAMLSTTPLTIPLIIRPALAAVFLMALRWPFMDLAFMT